MDLYVHYGSAHTDNNDIVRASISQKSTERNQLCFRIPYLKVNEKQRYLGICTPLLCKIWLICGLALIPIVAGIMLCFIGADTKTVGYVGAALLVFPLLLIILSVILTERALKNAFDKNGNPFSENTTIGIVLCVKKQWWLKVNTKPIRKHALDGATFPHIVTVKYTVDGNEIVKKKWLKSFVTPPSVNEQVAVIYRTDKPTKFRLEL